MDSTTLGDNHQRLQSKQGPHRATQEHAGAGIPYRRVMPKAQGWTWNYYATGTLGELSTGSHAVFHHSWMSGKPFWEQWPASTAPQNTKPRCYLKRCWPYPVYSCPGVMTQVVRVERGS